MSFEDHDPTVHLLRGAPAVHAWSKYRHTVPEWTLCGVRRGEKRKDPSATEWSNISIENPRLVTCRFCLDLLGPRLVAGQPPGRPA